MLRPLEDALRELETMEDWRDGFNSQAEVMGHLLSAELFANATLMVGRDKVRMRVVKEILQSLSHPLEQRLATTLVGAGAVDERDEYGLPIFHFNDIDLEPMKQLLRYAYTHQWSWSGEVQDFSSVLRFLRLVQKLGVKNLVRKIQKSIDVVMTTTSGSEFVRADTACQIFEDANSFGKIGENWKNLALKLILGSPSVIFEKVEHYKMLTSASLVEILKKKEMHFDDQLQLFQIVLAWAKARCIVEGQKVCVENLQRILKDVLPIIQFTKMSLEQFIHQVQPTGLLGTAKMLEIQTALCLQMVQVAGPSHDNGSPKMIRYETEEFGEPQKNDLLHQLSQQKNPNSGPLLVELTIELISDSKILMSFLERTAAPDFINLSLKVDTIKSAADGSSDFGKWNLVKFPQVSDLNFVCLAEQDQFQCLFQVVKKSINLKRLSIGHFEWCLHRTDTSCENMKKFLGMVLLKNLEFACGLTSNSTLTVDTFVRLQGNGVIVKKLGFNDSASDQASKVIEMVQEDLEEVHGLLFTIRNPIFQSTLHKLRILEIRCEWQILSRVLQKVPNLEKLIYAADNLLSYVTVHMKQLSLPQLTTLTLYMNLNEDPDCVGLQFSNCPNLSQLTCLNYAIVSMTPIYKNFCHIKQFRYVQRWGVSIENVVGMDKFALGLTSLSFGYNNYQYSELAADWRLDLQAFDRVMGQVTKLEKLSLPPMSVVKAKEILTSIFISRLLTQLKLVQFQMWSGQDMGYGGTMTTAMVEELALVHAAQRFKIEAVRVRRETGERTCFS